MTWTLEYHLRLSEIYCNQTDLSEKGSLLEVLDRTKTKFGARLLRDWIGRPLVDRLMLHERVEAVEEIKNSASPSIWKLKHLLRGMPDLVKGLCRVQYTKVCLSTSFSLVFSLW